MKKLFRFLKDVRIEMHKVRWPNKKEMFVYSCATIFCVVIFSLFFTGLDLVISLIKGVVH